MKYQNNNLKLSSDKIIQTLSLLEKRISDRFPDSGLRNVCVQFLETVKKSKSNINWIGKPNIPLRITSFLLIFLGIGGLIYSIKFVELKITNTTLTNIVTFSEAIFNDIILLGAAIYFLASFESRIKRKRALKALNELRVIAHVIDMHQLTKDPYLIQFKDASTKNSPKRTWTKFELERYLDYCSEATAIISKVAALYSQSLSDDVVVNAVNDIEVLSTGLNQKIWQKLVILNDSNMPVSKVKKSS